MVSTGQADAFSSVRLVFAYGPEGIELTERLPLQKRVPLSDDLDPSEHSGSFLELRTSSDEVLYRRVLGYLIPVDAEIHEPSGELRRVPLPEIPSGAFHTFVPDLDAAEHIVLLASADRLPQQTADALGLVVGQGAGEVARFPFREGGSDVEV